MYNNNNNNNNNKIKKYRFFVFVNSRKFTIFYPLLHRFMISKLLQEHQPLIHSFNCCQRI